MIGMPDPRLIQRMAEAQEADILAEIERKENAKLALFIKRLVGGLPLRRASDDRCKKLLLDSSTEEGRLFLRALLHKGAQASGEPL